MFGHLAAMNEITMMSAVKTNKNERIEPKKPRQVGLLRQVDVPLGEKNGMVIDQFTFDDKASWAHRTSMMYNGDRSLPIPPGTYTRLYRTDLCRTVVMSDTPSEMWDHKDFVDKANGRVLLAGLGIGMVLEALARKEEVTRIRVVENNQDVIDLVWAHYADKYGDKIELWNGSIFDYPGGETWDCAWFDIWDNKCVDNLEEMGKLKRKFPPRNCPVRGFWSEEDLRKRRSRERRSRWAW